MLSTNTIESVLYYDGDCKPMTLIFQRYVDRYLRCLSPRYIACMDSGFILSSHAIQFSKHRFRNNWSLLEKDTKRMYHFIVYYAITDLFSSVCFLPFSRKTNHFLFPVCMLHAWIHLSSHAI